MKNHRFFFLLSCLLCLPPVLGGCASYYSHYGLFPAENSEGDPRQVMLNWQTADYPDWWFVADKSTPITVTTQCSARSWRLADDSHAVAGECADQESVDYLRASPVPYMVHIRTSPRGALNGRPPVMDDSVCDAD